LKRTGGCGVSTKGARPTCDDDDFLSHIRDKNSIKIAARVQKKSKWSVPNCENKHLPLSGVKKYVKARGRNSAGKREPFILILAE